MTYLKSLPDADLKQVLRLQPAAGVPVAHYHEALMRGPSPFTEGERELIAAFVSGLNDCDFCTQEHAAVAAAFGISPGLLGGLLEDLETAAVADKMRAVLRFVRKLNDTPARMVRADAEAVFAAGWDDMALYHAASICGLFNLDNRIIQGLGIPAQDAAHLDATVERLHARGYASTARFIQGVPDEA